MSYSKLINPKKKRRVFATKESPFPVPIASITGEPPSETQWMYYTGNLVGNQVIVHHSGDISFLYKMGFFGKGTLSRSKTEFNQRCKMATLPTSGGTDKCRVISRRSYIRRLNWKNGKSNSQQDEYDSSQEWEFWEDEKNHMDVETSNVQHSDLPSTNIKEDIRNTSKKDLIGPEISQSADDDEWSAAVESWDNAEADEDFWGTGTDDKTPDIPSSSKGRTVPVPSTVTGGKQGLNSQESSKCNDDLMGIKRPTNVSNLDKNLQCDHFSFDNVLDGDDEKCSTAEQSKCVPSSENVNQVDIEDNQPTNVSQLCVKETKKKDSQNERDKEIKETDPLCLSSEEHGELFVMEDSDNEGVGGKRKWKEPEWRPVVKEDPYFVKEFLHLSLEESFFLAYGLGCLRVYENEKLLNLTDLWRAFCQRHSRFISLYVAYHYFRSKGWVPKSGLKFGTDFIIYKEGPPFYHGSYSVIVKMVRDEDLKEVDNLPTLTWTQIAGLNRLTEHVAKQLLICYVIRPTHVNSDLMLSPNVISQFKVKEIVVSRWVSSQERESKSTEEIP